MKPWRVPYPKFGDGSALPRVSAIAEYLGLDLASFGPNAAVITGSNGKGSTAAMTASILSEAGYKTGRFTSPHLFALNERFSIDGEDISDAALQHHWDRVRRAVRESGFEDAIGGFEFLFLIAADWFAAQRCDATVWEAGIGGRCDVTRLIRPHRTALVSLDLEHTSLLGKTLEEIAYDKLDAAPDGAKVFIGASCAPVRDRIEAYCAAKNLTPFFTTPLGVNAPLPGAHQRENASVAIALATSLGAVSEEALARGLEQTRWPGRLEIIDEHPLIVIDVGHTPAAIATALEGFRALQGDRNAVLICGASVDKAAGEIVALLAPSFSTVICAAARHKGAPAGQIAAAAQKANPAAEVSAAESIEDARRQALGQAGPDGAIYVAGGLFLAAEFKAAHLGRDPASLVFF